MRMQLTRASVVAILIAGCAASRPDAKIDVGERLEFDLPNLEGARTTPKDLLGKVVLVDLWATWCKPCKVSLPFYAELLEKHRSEGLEVVAISVDVHEDDVKQFVEKESLPFIVLHDPDGTVPARIGISALPTMMLIGRDGKLAYLHPGFEPDDKKRIAYQIEKALAAEAEVEVDTSTAAPGARKR